MFNDVQKRLTILYTAMTGLILVILLACIFMWNINSREQAESFSFQNLWLSVSTHLQMDSIFTQSYLAQTEAANHSLLHIEENGTPLLFSGAWTPKTPRTELVKKAFMRVEAEGVSTSLAPISSSMEQSDLFKMRGDNGDSYYGRMIVLPTENGFKSLLLLSYITPRTALIVNSLPLFLLLCAIGIISIFFVSRFFTARALNPARESAKKQVEFIAAASHELRSPLAVIRSGVSALRNGGEERGEGWDGRDGNEGNEGSDDNDGSEGSEGNEGSEGSEGSEGNEGNEGRGGMASEIVFGDADASDRILSYIDKECSRMARLVSDMLLLASTDAKNWTLLKKEVSTDTLLIETYETFLPLCRDKHLELILALPENALPPLMADRQRLEQALAILLDNAISYTPEGKSITLTAYEKKNPHMGGAGGSKVVIEVQDQGNGIPDEKKKQIFDRFYRGDASRNDKKHFGLGLSIARELVELHGGTIAVLDNPGGGSRFLIRL